MAVEIRINTLGGSQDFALPDANATVADLKTAPGSGYQAGQVVRVNGQDASDETVLVDGNVVSFATPATKHGLNA